MDRKYDIKNFQSQKTAPQLKKLIQAELPQDFFERSKSRVLYLILVYILFGIHFLITTKFLAGSLSILIWFLSFFILANVGTFAFFFMHEVLHGAVFKSPWAVFLSAFLGGIPFACTPYLWNIWHTHHHSYTATCLDTDRAKHPHYDDFNELSTLLQHIGKKFLYKDVLSYFAPFVVISGHHLLIFCQSFLSIGPIKIHKSKALIQYLIVASILSSPLFLCPLPLALLGIYIPILFANLICNLYILSNHNNNPLTESNYPLLNSTSVYLSKFMHQTHMGFGCHVEHHIFPTVTHDKLNIATNVLRKTYPKEFEEHNLFFVLHSIYSRKKIFQDIIR